ncbi:MAG: hypothetical protein Q7S09_01190 [bacterium]|nr:hypothetical protein [bacterium]
MLNLVFGLHMYQPPTQMAEVIKQIATESYRPTLRIIKDHPKAYVCIDIAASALELLEVHALDVVDLIRECLEKKKLFLVNTAAYHPILPLLPRTEIERQIAQNLYALKKAFGMPSIPHGCFLPEMAFSAEVLPALRRMQAGWTLADDVPYQALYGPHVPFNWVPSEQGTAIFLQSHLWQRRISFIGLPENRQYANGRVFAGELCEGVRAWQGTDADGYMVIWLDFETFGHHHKHLEESFFPPLFDASSYAELKLTDPDKLLLRYPKKDTVIPAGSWSTSSEQWQSGNYFPLWADKHNSFHLHWWSLVHLALGITERAADPNIRRLGDKMVYSCQPWQYAQGNRELARAGLHYFERVLESGTVQEQVRGWELLGALYDLTRG